MNPAVRDISEHMRQLGLGALQHANWHANYFSHENQWWSELSVLQAAHAAELLVKARIAEEHPLLVFEQLPKPQDPNQLLDIPQLIEKGRTIQFADLPHRLWAATGMSLPNLDVFNAFGRLRNSIQHFAAPPQMDLSHETLSFIYKVIDPFINECWELFAIDFNEDHEPYVYLAEGLIRRGILFLVSPGLMEDFEFVDTEWPDGNSEFRNEMEHRFKKAIDDQEKDKPSNGI